MIVYECDFCGKETKNENDVKRTNNTKGDVI